MKYMSLDQKGAVMAEYIWIDSNGGTRSKTKVCRYLQLFDASRLACDGFRQCRLSISPTHGPDIAR